LTLAWNPGSGSAIAGYRLYEGAACRTYTNVIDVGNVTTKTVTGLVGGATYFFAVTAYNTNGQESDFSGELSYTVPLPTNTPPTIALTAPVDGASFAAPVSISLAATVTANGHTIIKVQFSEFHYINGILVNAALVAECTSAPYTFAWSNMSAGSYTLTAVAVYDSGSAVASGSANVTVTPAPSVALTFPADGASYTVPATIPLAASVTANGHSITQVQFYNGATLLGAVAAAPYSFSWTNVSLGNYGLSAKAVYDSGSTVSSAPANVTVEAAGRPGSGLTFAADSGAISAPFVATNGTVFQPITTGVTNGGRAAYAFNIVNAGDYLVSALVSAPSLSQNSFYVNIDAEPTNPLMSWDIPVSTGLTSRTVSWRGNGNGDPASAQYSPKVFTLSAGAHQLIIRGQEAATILGAISIAATPPKLQIQAAGGSVVLSGTGQPGQTYNVLSSQDLVNWIFIGMVTFDASGSGQFTDPVGTGRPNCVYRLQGQ
jgi:hypothetical protein